MISVLPMLSLLLLLLQTVCQITQEPQFPQQPPVIPSSPSPSPSSAESSHDSIPPITNIVIASIGIILIIIELFVWRTESKQESIVAFSVFNNKQTQDRPSLSYNDFYVEKKQSFGNANISASSTNANGQPISASINQHESPVIKTIKGMTSEKSEQLSERRRRKRKADKMSDRRSKEIIQNQ